MGVLGLARADLNLWVPPGLLLDIFRSARPSRSVIGSSLSGGSRFVCCVVARVYCFSAGVGA